MIKKSVKSKKNKLKSGVDATHLVSKLEELYSDGKHLLSQPIIDIKDYDNWFETVLALLKSGFTEPNNKYKNSFVLPAGYILTRQDGVSSAQPDLQAELSRDLSEQLLSLNNIINDIRIHYCN